MELKGKIDQDGILNLDRGDGWQKVYCPLNPYGLGCGTWCALFDYYSNGSDGNYIHLCHKKYLIYYGFSVERKKRK